MLLGTTCSPSEPACGFEESCTEDEIRSCINFCAPVYSEPVLDDVHCALDACDAETMALPDVWRCPLASATGQAYRCAFAADSPDPARIGVCRATRGFLDVCDPKDPDACETNTFCLPRDCPDALPDRIGLTGTDPGYCALPAREGTPCTGNLGDESPGCRACEWGTRCQDTAQYGRICLRACATSDAPDVPRPELCACSAEGGCLSWEEHGTPEPAPGEPRHYCAAPTIPNGGRCTPNRVPCESGRCQETPHRFYGETHICCRVEGDSCASEDDCCPGRATCFGGVCTTCGRDGEAPTNAGCCEGTTIIEGTCRSCTASREGRDASSRAGTSCEGDFVQFEAGDRNVTFGVPVRGNTGAGLADLPLVTIDPGGVPRFEPLSAVRYRLQPDHRLFLLQGDLSSTSGVTAHHQFVQFPANFASAGPREFRLEDLEAPPSTWTSMRVYHAGACSRFVGYEAMVEGITAAMNRFLVTPQFGIFGSTPLTLQDARVTPTLRSGRGDIARSVESDEVELVMAYQAVDGEAFACPNGWIELRAGFRVIRRGVFLPTMDAELTDLELTREHDCPSPRTGRCRCSIDGTLYRCRVLGPSTSALFFVDRPVRYVRDAFDYEVDLLYLDGGVIDCIHSASNDLLTGILAGHLAQQLPEIMQQVVGGLTIQGPPYPAELGISFDDLADCGRTHPDTGELFGSDAMCGDASPRFFGGRRHRCVGFNDDGTRNNTSPTQFRCADLRIELRRAHLRPDGVEVVFADSSSDPQYPAMTALRGQPIFDGVCEPERSGVLIPTQAPRSGTVETRTSSLLTITADSGGRRICHPDDPIVASGSLFVGCSGICVDAGAPCNFLLASFPRADGGPRFPGNRDATVRDRCYMPVVPDPVPPARPSVRGYCCRPEEFCPIPPTTVAGSDPGIRFFGDPADPPLPSEFYRCVDLTSDSRACGSCGSACDPGLFCCDAACTDLGTDRAHCGECDEACPPSTDCLDGSCCPTGQRVCGGRCVDLQSDPSDCGGCGAACGAGQVCSAGVCCDEGQASCDGTCIDILSDDTNCGGCDVACSGSDYCSVGTCCPPGTADCGADGTCNSLTSLANCGRCGNSCPIFPPHTCQLGTCVRL